jgi:hypothetical protein
MSIHKHLFLFDKVIWAYAKVQMIERVDFQNIGSLPIHWENILGITGKTE